jgi:hypothetical protein
MFEAVVRIRRLPYHNAGMSGELSDMNVKVTEAKHLAALNL